MILGLQSVKTLVLGFSLVSTLSKTKASGFNHLKYWRRSIFAATAARTLATKMNLVQQEEVFLAALLQDIGMLVLNQVISTQYGEISAKANTHAELIKAEQESLELTHAEVGGDPGRAVEAAARSLQPPSVQATIPARSTDPVLRKSPRSSRSPASPPMFSSMPPPPRPSFRSVPLAPPPIR